MENDIENIAEDERKLLENVESIGISQAPATNNIENLPPEYQFLDGITKITNDNIGQFLNNTKALNAELANFKKNNDNKNLEIVLKLHKYLIVAQNFVDSSKPQPTATTTINTFFKKTLTTITNLTLGLLEIYVGLTGKNLQRVVSNYPIDGNEHTLQDYIDAIFLNWQNYLMVFIDTTLATFLTSAASSWSRDVIFNKQNKIKSLEIKQLNTEGFEKYQKQFAELLNKNDYKELIKYFPKIVTINNLIKKFNEIEKPINNENENIAVETNESEIIEIETNENKIKAVVAAINKTGKELTKANAKPLTLKQKGYYFLNDLSLELFTWSMSHIMIAGASANTTHEDFTIYDWPKYIINKGALIANFSRYLAMRPVNYIFKSGLERLGITTTIICPKKFAEWVNKQTRKQKLLMAIPLFSLITVFTNIVKTEAALVTEYGIDKSRETLKLKLEKGLTWLFFSLTTAADMTTFSVSGFYKLFNRVDTKTIVKALTNCCQLTKAETIWLENKITTLAKDNKLPNFNEEFNQFQNKNQEQINDSGYQEIEQLEDKKNEINTNESWRNNNNLTANASTNKHISYLI